MDRLDELKQKLQEFTTGCRHDMHEPDEQGISAVVRGGRLDNAHGECLDVGTEFVVILKRSTDEGEKTFPINLASLIAIARRD